MNKTLFPNHWDWMKWFQLWKSWCSGTYVSISDRTWVSVCLHGLTVRIRSAFFVMYNRVTCCVYLQMVRMKDEHIIYLKWLCMRWDNKCVKYFQCFSMFWRKEKQIVMNMTLILYLRELIKLHVLGQCVKYCNDIVFLSLLEYFSIKSFWCFILAFFFQNQVRPLISLKLDPKCRSINFSE